MTRQLTGYWMTLEVNRTFGEYVYSVRLKNKIQEMMLKGSLYNKLISR